MKRRIALLSLVASLCGGCFALDVLEESEREMDRITSGGAETAEAEAAGAAPEEKGPSPSEQWWGKVRTFTPGQSNSGIVRCEVGGSVQFAKRSDCLARGGRPSPRG